MSTTTHQRVLRAAAILGVPLAALAVFGFVSEYDIPTDRAALYSIVILCWLSLLTVVLVYGLLTPWYRSRTGIGFMSTKVSFLTIITLTIINALWWKIPLWLNIAAWAFIVVTINYGITWNILYKQFFEHRADQVSNKTRTASQQGVHDTGVKMSEPAGVEAPTPTPGPDHRAAPASVSVSVPAKAFWRTALQVGPAAVISLVVILPAVIQDIVAGFGEHLPEGFRVWLLGVAGFLTLAAAVAARIMANPAVQAWLRVYAPFFSLPAATKETPR